VNINLTFFYSIFNFLLNPQNHSHLQYHLVCFSACVFLSVCLPVRLSVCLFVCLSLCMYVCLYGCMSVYHSVCLPFCLSTILSVYNSVCLSFLLTFCHYRSFIHSISVSFFLHVFLYNIFFLLSPSLSF